VCGRARVEVTLTTPSNDTEVDLLLVIDGSPSMDAFRDGVVNGLSDVVREVASGDHDGDGVIDFEPARRLHVGVIGTELGACAGAADAGFRTIGTGVGGCATDYGAVHPRGLLSFRAGRDDPDQLASDVRCLMGAVQTRCPFSRATDAITRALEESINPGFLSDGAVLAILVVSAQDDCSTSHPEIFQPALPAGTPQGVRCSAAADQLTNIDEVASALRARRPNPALLFVSIASGVPPSLAGVDPSILLADPALVERIDPAHSDRLVPACTTSSHASAAPARRWTELARALNADGAQTTVQSICNPDLHPLADVYVERGTETRYGICLPRGLAVDAQGLVPCELTMALPPIGTSVEPEHCSDLPSPEAFQLDHVEAVTDPVDGTLRSREVCRVRQVGYAGAGTEVGWSYDDGSPQLMPAWSWLPMGCTQRIGLSAFEPGHEWELRAICDESVIAATHSAASRGLFCGTGRTDCSLGHAIDGDTTSATLSCNDVTHTCELACTSDEDCVAGGLRGFVCDDHHACTSPACLD